MTLIFFEDMSNVLFDITIKSIITVVLLSISLDIVVKHSFERYVFVLSPKSFKIEIVIEEVNRLRNIIIIYIKT